MKKIKIIEEGVLDTHDMLEVNGGQPPMCTQNKCPNGYLTQLCWNMYIQCGEQRGVGYHSCWNNGSKLTCNQAIRYEIKLPLPW